MQFFVLSTFQAMLFYRSFVSTMNSLRPNKKWVTKLSSAGLVYNHFGYDILSHLLGLPSTEGSVDLIYDKVYASFVEEVDAIDNGIHQTDEEPRCVFFLILLYSFSDKN